MKINVHFSLRDGSAFAEAVYLGDRIIVKKGGRISANFASYIKGGKLALSKRNNPEIVDVNRYIISDCEFKSPSTAAQFVGGRSFNGYKAWKVEKRKDLEKYLKENGLR